MTWQQTLTVKHALMDELKELEEAIRMRERRRYAKKRRAKRRLA